MAASNPRTVRCNLYPPCVHVHVTIGLKHTLVDSRRNYDLRMLLALVLVLGMLVFGLETHAVVPLAQVDLRANPASFGAYQSVARR
jgi:hypothetical protein